MAESSILRLTFLMACEFDAGKAIRGAFLTTDADTKPLEFRCTTAIRPTQLQRILYGDSLKGHLLVELMSVPLLKAANEKPSLLLVSDQIFLPLRKRTQTPLVWVGKHSASADVLPKDAEAADHVITSPSGHYEPILIMTHPEFLSELQETRTCLSEVMNQRDILEPFDRIRVALEHVHKQNLGEQHT